MQAAVWLDEAGHSSHPAWRIVAWDDGLGKWPVMAEEGRSLNKKVVAWKRRSPLNRSPIEKEGSWAREGEVMTCRPHGFFKKDKRIRIMLRA